jgi:hypothetical protein
MFEDYSQYFQYHALVSCFFDHTFMIIIDDNLHDFIDLIHTISWSEEHEKVRFMLCERIAGNIEFLIEKKIDWKLIQK